MKQSAVMHPTQKYAWVCSFQETPSEPITSNCDQFIFDLGEERDQLREQVKMLRDALEVTHELYANSSSGYGFARPENPHNFHCDIDCCSKEEIAAHSKACDDYAAGRKVSNDSWGIGTYCDEYAPAIEALAATEPITETPTTGETE